MEPRDYLARTKLTCDITLVRDAQRELWGVLEDSRHRSLPAIPSAMDRYYRFKVPRLAPDGSCSLPGELEKEPYDLGATLGGRTPQLTATFLTIDSFLEHVMKKSGAAWLGVYQARTTAKGPTLVKLSYKGGPSRAEFPLTIDFAKKSTNVAVALSGAATLISDVKAHLAAGGAYYQCDPKTQSELCLPVFDQGGVIAVVDAEHPQAGHFDAARQAMLVALALELPAVLPAGGVAAPKS